MPGYPRWKSAQHMFHLNPIQLWNLNIIIIFLGLLFSLQIQKLRLKEIKFLAQGYTARRDARKDESVVRMPSGKAPHLLWFTAIEAQCWPEQRAGQWHPHPHPHQDIVRAQIFKGHPDSKPVLSWGHPHIASSAAGQASWARQARDLDRAYQSSKVPVCFQALSLPTPV